MPLIKQFYISSNAIVEDRGGVFPPWSSGDRWDNKANWYMGNYDTDYFYNLTGDNVDNSSFFLQYGQNTSVWASAKFLSYSVFIGSQYTDPALRTITIWGGINPAYFVSRATDFSTGSGVSVIWSIRINGAEVWNYTGNTTDEFTNLGGNSVTFDAVIQPLETYTQTAFEIFVTYPNGEYPNNHTIVGVAFTNTNEPPPQTYKPWAIRTTGGAWQDLNTAPNGAIYRRVGTVWQDFSEESRATIRDVGTGHNRFRSGNQWRQSPPMIGGVPE